MVNPFEAMHQMRCDYGMTKPGRFKRDRTGFDVNGSGADYHIRSQSQYLKMIELAREMEREDPLVRQAVRRVVNNVQPGGATPDPQTGDDEVNEILFDGWEEWGSDPLKCHAGGKLTWRKMTNVGFARTLVDGDFSGLPTDDDKIMTLEAHRMRSPDTGKTFRGVCGVESDESGKPTKYWFTKEQVNPNERVKVSDVQSVNAVDSQGYKQVFHVFDAERLSGSRGITRFAPVYDIRGMADDAEFAQLVRTQVGACTVYAEEWAVGSDPPADNPQSYGPETSDRWVDGTSRTTVQMSPGQILRSRYPGMSWKALNPNAPGEGYHQQIYNLLTYFAVNLDLPRMVLLLDASDANFSSYRNVMQQARDTYREINKTLFGIWHTPIWNWRCRVMLAKNERLQRFVASKGPDGLRLLMKHVWNPVGYEYIEPVADATRNRIEIAEGMTSFRRFYAKTAGTDNESMAKEIIEDNAFRWEQACLKARELNTKFPEFPIKDPRLLCPFPNAAGVTISETRSETTEPETKPSGSPDAKPA